MDSAIIIQRVYRGHAARFRVILSNRVKNAVVIQSWWRTYSAKRFIDVLLKRKKALATLGHIIRARIFSRRFKSKIALRVKYAKITVVQRMVKVFLARRELYQLRIDHRRKAEMNLASSFSLLRGLAEYQLAIFHESLRRPIGKKVNNACGEECVFTGPVQALFMYAIGPKARTDLAALTTNRIDTKRLTKLFEKVSGRQVNFKLPVKMYALASALEQDLFKMPSPVRKLSTTDLDIIFAKYRSTASVGSGIGYAEFTQILREVGMLHFRGLRDDQDEKGLDTKPNGRIEISTLSCPGFEDLMMVLKIVFTCHYDGWFGEVASFLNNESRARLGRLVERVQRLVRRKIARAMVGRLRLLLESERKRHAYYEQIILAQSIIRRFIHWRRAIRIAQILFTEYIPYDGNPRYWYNPRTRVSKFTKPTLLGPFQCRVIPLSIPGFETLIHCSNCGNTAEVNCGLCRESYCVGCFSSIHCKGSRREHVPLSIAFCSYCMLQHATKSCTACSVVLPDRYSPIVLMKGDRRLFCDSCFQHHHDPRDAEEIRAEFHLLTITRELSLARPQLLRRPFTRHRYDELVQPCEECQWRAASQRCLNCDQIYCSACLSTLHSQGNFSRHKAELLPYYTPLLHVLYLKDVAMHLERERIDIVIRDYAETFRSWYHAAVLKVQTWWRKIYYGRHGRAFMREVRLEQRRFFRLRQSDDKHFRNKLIYRIRDVFGLNPPLKSDSREERALKSIPAFMREGAREYILKNKEDWAFFRLSRTDPRKGVPKMGFDVGSIEELADQAKRGGYRMPGRVSLIPGKSEAKCTANLDQFSIINRFIRIGESVYLVTDVGEKLIVLDRNAHPEAAESLALLYLLPSRLYNPSYFCYVDRRAVYYAVRYSLYDSAFEYTASQACIAMYVGALSGAVKAVRGMVSTNLAFIKL